MKREAVFIACLFLFFSFVGFASAGCSNDQIIMKLSSTSTSNTHGALWNQSGTSICYNTFFDTPPTGTQHDGCTSPNNGLLLKLYDINNSHAAYPTFAPSLYGASVCYNGLKNCKLEPCASGNNKCRTIVYISNKTNAHISSGNFIPASDRGYLPISCECTGSNCLAIPPPVGPTGCYDYTFEDDCESAGDIAQSDPGCKGDSCECVWNATAIPQCSVRWTTIDPSTGCAYSCIVSGSEATECSGGSQVIRTLATITTSQGCQASNAPVGFVCQSGSKTVPCGTLEEASLPFFGLWQLVVSLISIALIYGLLERKRLF